MVHTKIRKHDSVSCTDRDCAVCETSFNNIEHAQCMLLHWHAKLDHMNYKQLRDLALRGCIPRICARDKLVKCPAYQQGKATLKKTDRNNKIVK